MYLFAAEGVQYIMFAFVNVVTHLETNDLEFFFVYMQLTLRGTNAMLH